MRTVMKVGILVFCITALSLVGRAFAEEKKEELLGTPVQQLTEAQKAQFRQIRTIKLQFGPPFETWSEFWGKEKREDLEKWREGVKKALLKCAEEMLTPAAVRIVEQGSADAVLRVTGEFGRRGLYYTFGGYANTGLLAGGWWFMSAEDLTARSKFAIDWHCPGVASWREITDEDDIINMPSVKDSRSRWTTIGAARRGLARLIGTIWGFERCMDAAKDNARWAFQIEWVAAGEPPALSWAAKALTSEQFDEFFLATLGLSEQYDSAEIVRTVVEALPRIPWSSEREKTMEIVIWFAPEALAANVDLMKNLIWSLQAPEAKSVLVTALAKLDSPEAHAELLQFCQDLNQPADVRKSAIHDLHEENTKVQEALSQIAGNMNDHSDVRIKAIDKLEWSKMDEVMKKRVVSTLQGVAVNENQPADVCLAAAMKLESLKGKYHEISFLGRLVGDGSQLLNVRRLAVKKLKTVARADDQRTLDVLVAVLEDQNEAALLRQDCLELAGEGNAERVGPVASAIVINPNEPDELRSACFEWLKKHPGAADPEVLVQIGADVNQPKEVRVDALRTLAEKEKTQLLSVTKKLAALLTDPQQPEEIRKEIPKILARTGEEEMVKVLIEVVQDETTPMKVRNEALEGVGQGLSVEDPALRLAAIKVLGNGETVEVLRLLLRTLADEDEKVVAAAKEEAAKVVERVGAKGVDVLLEALPPVPATHKPAIISWVLELTHHPRVVMPLVDLLGSSSPVVQEAAARGLGKLRDRRATAPLVELLRSEYEAVAIGAAWALGAIGDLRATEPLCERLNDPGVKVVIAVAQALGKIGDRRAIGSLKEALTTAKEEELRQELLKIIKSLESG